MQASKGGLCLRRLYAFSLGFAGATLLLTPTLNYLLINHSLSQGIVFLLVAGGFVGGSYIEKEVYEWEAVLLFLLSALILLTGMLGGDKYALFGGIFFFFSLAGRLSSLIKFQDSVYVIGGGALTFIALVSLNPFLGGEAIITLAVALLVVSSIASYTRGIEFEMRKDFSPELGTILIVTTFLTAFVLSYTRVLSWIMDSSILILFGSGSALLLIAVLGYLIYSRLELGISKLTLFPIPPLLFLSLLPLSLIKGHSYWAKGFLLLPILSLTFLPPGLALGSSIYSLKGQEGKKWEYIFLSLPAGYILDLLISHLIGTTFSIFFFPSLALASILFITFMKNKVSVRWLVNLLALVLILGGAAAMTTSGLWGNDSILYQEESGGELIQVVEEGEGLVLKINRYAHASNKKSYKQTEAFTAYAPLFLHPGEPQEVLFLGIGGGYSLEEAMNFKVSIDAVDSSAHIEAVRNFLSTSRDSLQEDESFSLTHGKPMGYLKSSGKSYDVIISLPKPPWQAGNPAYTREFYALAKIHLSGEGIFAQKLGKREYQDEELKTMINTFMEVFPHATMWYSGGDVLLVGGREPLDVNYSRIRNSILEGRGGEEYKSYFKGRVYTDSNLVDQFLSNYVMNPRGLRSYSTGSNINTLFKPHLQFSTRSNFYSPPNKTIMGNLLLYKLGVQGNPYIYPSLEGLYHREGDIVSLDFLGIEASFSKDWREDFVGYTFRYQPFNTPQGIKYAKSYDKKAIFRRGKESLSFYSFEPRTLSSGEDISQEGFQRRINEEIREILQGRLRTLEQEKWDEKTVLVGEREGLMVKGKGEKESIVIGWYCRGLKEIMVVSYQYEGVEKQGIPAGFACQRKNSSVL